MAGDDRLTMLLEQNALTGIDFIQVVDPADQTVLRVFFLLDPDKLDDPVIETADLPADVPADTVSIASVSGGERLAKAPVVRATYVQVQLDGRLRTVLEVQTSEPGDFSIYRLTVNEPRIDRFFNGVEFTFKQGCPSVLDCRPRDPECPPEPPTDFPVDYLARDFVSLRSALLDFAAQRYPQWIERIEADAGVMLAEVMAAAGDELSYLQDRYAREAHLETATQRRSVRRHAQLVDYHVHNGLSAATILDLQVKSGGTFVVAGSRVWAPGQGEPSIVFELGTGLGSADQFWVHEAWNEIAVHVTDSNRPCLPAGAAELYLRGTFPDAAQLPPGQDPAKAWIGKALLLRTDPDDPSVPARRHLVRVVEIEQTTDPLAPESPPPFPVTRIRWEESGAPPFEMCLHDLTVHANLVPATAGETITEFLAIRAGAAQRAVERQGPLDDVAGQRSVTFLHTLSRTERESLGWLGALRDAQPELEVQEVDPVSLTPLVPPRVWQWQPDLLHARAFDDQFTLDEGAWRRIVAFRRAGEVIEHADYAGSAGFTLRFGDGEFGKVPPDGTVFRVRYRTGPGARANLPPDTVVNLTNPEDATQADLAGVLSAVTNPFPITSGVDPENAAVAKQLAPEAFRELTFRAVRPEDYADIAERLPWVQRAGARFRWTGSWLSAFVTADPEGTFELAPDKRTELENLMNAVRQAGREVYVRDPLLVNIDLEIAVCVEPSAYSGQVKARVAEALLGRRGVRPLRGFFHPDNFTFGTPLRRAALEAAVQNVAGVDAVERIRIRARGITNWRVLDELIFPVGDNQIIRLENDPRFPERGSLRVVVRQ